MTHQSTRKTKRPQRVGAVRRRSGWWSLLTQPSPFAPGWVKKPQLKSAVVSGKKKKDCRSRRKGRGTTPRGKHAFDCWITHSRTRLPATREKKKAIVSQGGGRSVRNERNHRKKQRPRRSTTCDGVRTDTSRKDAPLPSKGKKTFL